MKAQSSKKPKMKSNIDSDARDSLPPKSQAIVEAGTARVKALMERIYSAKDGGRRPYADTPSMLRELVEGIIEITDFSRTEAGQTGPWVKTDARLAIGLLHDNAERMLDSISSPSLSKLINLIEKVLDSDDVNPSQD